MSLKRNPIILRLTHSLPNRPIGSRFFKRYWQQNLNRWLTESMERFNYPFFKLALYLGADPHIEAQTQKGYPLVTRCARSGEALFLDTLLAFGASPQANLPPGNYLPIHMAAIKGMDLSIEVLVKYGADIHAVYELENMKTLPNCPIGWTPLICACLHNKTMAAKKLLDLGANPLDMNEKGQSALNICVKLKNQELANYILEQLSKEEKNKLESQIPSKKSTLSSPTVLKI